MLHKKNNLVYKKYVNNKAEKEKYIKKSVYKLSVSIEEKVSVTKNVVNLRAFLGIICKKICRCSQRKTSA